MGELTKVTVRMPEDLHQDLKLAAVRERSTVQDIINRLVEQHLRGDETAKAAPAVSADAQPRDVAAREVKTDWK